MPGGPGTDRPTSSLCKNSKTKWSLLGSPWRGHWWSDGLGGLPRSWIWTKTAKLELRSPQPTDASFSTVPAAMPKLAIMTDNFRLVNTLASYQLPINMRKVNYTYVGYLFTMNTTVRRRNKSCWGRLKWNRSSFGLVRACYNWLCAAWWHWANWSPKLSLPCSHFSDDIKLPDPIEFSFGGSLFISHLLAINQYTHRFSFSTKSF